MGGDNITGLEGLAEAEERDVQPVGQRGCAAAVVGVMVRTQNVLDGLAGNTLDLGDDLFVVLLELVVDQDHAFAGDIHGDVAAVTFDLV